MGKNLPRWQPFGYFKTLSLCFTFCAFISPAFATQGVLFTQNSNWAEALLQAKSAGKMVFLDAITEWSGPCKLMNKCVFTDPSVGEFYNSAFISIKIDMEKGEGPALAKRYGIRQFPTLLFIDGEGNIQHQAIGFYNAAEFIKLGRRAMNTELNLYALQQRYAMGERSSSLLFDLTETYNAFSHPDLGKIADQYLKTQSDWSTTQNMEFIFQYMTDPFSPGFQYMLKNRSAFVRLFSEEALANTIDDIFYGYQKTHPNLPLGEVQRLYTMIYPERGEQMASAYRLEYYQKQENWAAYSNSAVEHFDLYPTDDAEALGQTALLFLHHVENRKMLKKSTKWAERAVALSPTWYNYDTLARLYAVTGKKRQAIKMTHVAIELARNSGTPSDNSEAFLDILRG